MQLPPQLKEFTMATPYKRLNKDDAVVLLVDHQTGLISLVQDFSPNEFKNNVLALADVAKFFNLPTILTTSFDQGPNGPRCALYPAAWPDQCLG
jgi:nicotinamidase-related amidase